MSGVYIKNMEMPSGCSQCYFNMEYGECVAMQYDHLGNFRWETNERHKDCPLVPVPDHGRLIDADEIGLTDFEIILCQADDNRHKSALQMLLEQIEEAPTIIPAEEGGKHG